MTVAAMQSATCSEARGEPWLGYGMVLPARQLCLQPCRLVLSFSHTVDGGLAPRRLVGSCAVPAI